MQVRKPIKRYSHTPGRENWGFYNRDTFHTPNRDTPSIPQQDIPFHQQMKSQNSPNSPDCFTNSSYHQFEELKQIGKDDPLMQFLQEQTKQREDNNQQHARSQQLRQQRKQLVYNRQNIKTRPVSSIGEDSKYNIQNNDNNNNQDSLDSTRSRESLSQWVPPSRYCSDNKRKLSCNSVDRSKRIVQKQQQQIDYPNDSKQLINEWKHFRQFIVVTDARKKLLNLQNNRRHLSRAKPVGAYLTNSYLLESSQSQSQQQQLEKQPNNNEQKQFFNYSNNSPAKMDKTHEGKLQQHNQANQDHSSQQSHQSCQSEQVKIMNFDPFRVEQESPEKEIEGWYMPMGSTMPRFLKSRESILHKKDQLKQQNKMKFNDTFVNCNHSSVHTEASSEARTRATTDEIQMENSSILFKKQNYLHTQDLPVSAIPSVQNHKKEGSCFSSRKQDHQPLLKKEENNVLKRATTPLQQRTADRLARGYSASQEEIYKPSAIKNHIAQIEEINQKNMMLSNTQQFLMTEYNKFFGQEQKQTRGDSPKLFMVNLGAQLSIKSVELSPSLSRQQYRRKKGIAQKDGSSPIVPTRVKILQDILKQQQQLNKQDLPSMLGLKKAI